MHVILVKLVNFVQFRLLHVYISKKCLLRIWEMVKKIKTEVDLFLFLMMDRRLNLAGSFAKFVFIIETKNKVNRKNKIANFLCITF